MKKTTMIVGALVVAGSVWFASDVSAGCCGYGSNYANARNGNQGAMTYVDRNAEACPWYKRWFGFHNAGCAWSSAACDNNVNGTWR